MEGVLGGRSRHSARLDAAEAAQLDVSLGNAATRDRDGTPYERIALRFVAHRRRFTHNTHNTAPLKKQAVTMAPQRVRRRHAVIFIPPPPPPPPQFQFLVALAQHELDALELSSSYIGRIGAKAPMMCRRLRCRARRTGPFFAPRAGAPIERCDGGLRLGPAAFRALILCASRLRGGLSTGGLGLPVRGGSCCCALAARSICGPCAPP